MGSPLPRGSIPPGGWGRSHFRRLGPRAPDVQLPVARGQSGALAGAGGQSQAWRSASSTSRSAWTTMSSMLPSISTTSGRSSAVGGSRVSIWLSRRLVGM